MDRFVNLSDGQLVALVVEGDADAVTHLLVNRCGAGLKYLAQSKYRTLGIDFHELVSEVYLLLCRNQWQALRDFRGSNEQGQACKLSNYVRSIAVLIRKARDKTAKQVKKKPDTSCEEKGAMLCSWGG